MENINKCIDEFLSRKFKEFASTPIPKEAKEALIKGMYSRAPKRKKEKM